MVKTIAAVIAAATLAVSAADTNLLRRYQGHPNDALAQYALDYVCSTKPFKGTECSALPAPQIQFAHIYFLQGWWGYFWEVEGAADSIVMDFGTREALYSGDPDRLPKAWSVLVHEAAHYADHALLMSDPWDACGAETIGWHVGNLWLIEHGHHELAAWNWRDWYGC